MGNPTTYSQPKSDANLTREESEGEFRTRVEFNPGASGYVEQLKQAGAKLIDLIDGASVNPKFSERQVKSFGRLKALALTAIEEGTSWAVKMATV